jgi:hypothetical protein
MCNKKGITIPGDFYVRLTKSSFYDNCVHIQCMRGRNVCKIRNYGSAGTQSNMKLFVGISHRLQPSELHQIHFRISYHIILFNIKKSEDLYAGFCSSASYMF